MSFPAALFVVFLVLKLCGVIAWSWWWVSAPLWLPLLVVLGLTALVALMLGRVAAVGLVAGLNRKRG